MKTMKQKLQRAFTITELVIVIAVIAILAAVLIPTFSSVVSSARESAAMQECSNARTTYLNESKGTLENGIVFINHDYAYVEYSGQLHLLGKLEELTKIGADGVQDRKGKLAEDIAAFKMNATTPGEVDVTTVQVTVTDESNVEGKPVLLLPVAGENVYFYEIEVNKTKYVGYFLCAVTLGSDPAKGYTIDNTMYSRTFGFVAEKGSAKITVGVQTKAGG